MESCCSPWVLWVIQAERLRVHGHCALLTLENYECSSINRKAIVLYFLPWGETWVIFIMEHTHVVIWTSVTQKSQFLSVTEILLFCVLLYSPFITNRSALKLWQMNDDIITDWLFWQTKAQCNQSLKRVLLNGQLFASCFFFLFRSVNCAFYQSWIDSLETEEYI